MNKRTLLAALAPSALGLGVSVLVWDLVPDLMPIHWDAHGVADGFAPKIVGLLMLPLLGLFAAGVTTLATRRAAKNRSVVHAMVLGVGGFHLGMHSLAISAALTPGHAIAMNALFVFLGMLFGGLGLAMPHLKQNRWAGVRTPWTMSNEVNWNLTHRFAAWSMGIGGGITIVLASVLSAPSMTWLCIAVVLFSSLLPAGYSYLLHRMQKNR